MNSIVNVLEAREVKGIAIIRNEREGFKSVSFEGGEVVRSNCELVLANFGNGLRWETRFEVKLFGKSAVILGELEVNKFLMKRFDTVSI